ncbi:hypothetical protein C3K47_11930 [Solitalea longa]|uniref:Uncharacterized protein n=1 Tax=Solitalea longa TaxID=2079460 RepID=A0A2S5A1L6_9SPHI|nr:hypothetical protein [Solitalea longa]POY36445.1 hypothetical protein C3K47_11930 [Solitalea longa]
MIPQKILALFEFIDYLDKNKKSYIEKYIPLCNELQILDEQRSKLKPERNYIEKQEYDYIQDQISAKFSPILSNIYAPVSEKLIELGIWTGENNYSSIWNNNISAISDFKRNFTSEDVLQVINYKVKYLTFRTETNSNFLCLQLIFNELDEIFKTLFDFFKDTNENEFNSFETKTIKVDSLEEAVKGLIEKKGNNISFSIPSEKFHYGLNETQMQRIANIKNEIVMGDKIEVGNISNNSGQIIIGKEIRISDSLNGKQETFEKIEELIKLIRQEPNISDEQRQNLITNFDKVKEEVLEEMPDKSKIFKWLSNTKRTLENLVLTHEAIDAINWVYKNLNFLIQQIGG